MNQRYTLIFALITLLCQCFAVAQPSLPTVQIGTRTYYYYVAKRKANTGRIAKEISVPKSIIELYNPGIGDAIPQGSYLFFPTTDFNSPEKILALEQLLNAKGTTSEVKHIEGKTIYQLQPNETIFDLPGKFNTSLQAIFELNPGYSPDAYTANSKLAIIRHYKPQQTYQKKIQQIFHFQVKDGTSLDELAAQFRIAPELIQQANFFRNNFKKGSFINIPITGDIEQRFDQGSIPSPSLRTLYHDQIDSIYRSTTNVFAKKGINISLMLPFMLNEPTPPISALLYTEFYRGLIMGLESKKHTNLVIRLNVFDTDNNLQKIDSLSKIPIVNNSEVVIVPGDTLQITKVLHNSTKANQLVLSPFLQTTYPDTTAARYVQIGITPEKITDAIKHRILSEHKDKVLLFIKDESPENETFQGLRQFAASHKLQRKELSATSQNLSSKQISNLLDPGSDYLVIPNKISPELLSTLVAVQHDRFDCKLKVIDYQEYYGRNWQTNDIPTDLDMLVFSRFHITNNLVADSLKIAYQQQFGESPTNTMPSLLLYGYDLGQFLIDHYTNLASTQQFHDFTGLQSKIRLSRKYGFSPLENHGTFQLLIKKGIPQSEEINNKVNITQPRQ